MKAARALQLEGMFAAWEIGRPAHDPGPISGLRTGFTDCARGSLAGIGPFWRSGVAVVNSLRCRDYSTRAVTARKKASRFWSVAVMVNARAEQFRVILNNERCIHPASVFDPMSARVAEHVGFELGMLAGSTASLSVLGAPDLVLLTATEFADQARRITRVFTRPLLVDADHGYGNALNSMRTVSELAGAGVVAATIEDTLLPAPFGASGKSGLVTVEEGVGKMRAALAARPDGNFFIVGRTSAPMISNLADAVARLQAYEAAGVDALFVVGLKSADELKAVAEATTLPLIVGSRIGNLTPSDMASLHVRICLQGHLPMAAAVQAIYRTMRSLREGVNPSDIDGIAPAALMNELTRQEAYSDQIRSFMR